MEVIVEGVSYLMQTQKSFWENPSNLFAPPERTLLLNNINLYLKSGSITCFLGTGDGQKRLLELIALKQTEGFMSGNILHDNLIRPNGNYKDIAYVTRDNNTYYEGLTVFDYLYFGARLRLTLTQIETREKIREVIKLVGLDGGLKINRLRKGEMVLLAIALELVNSPTLLILDNPVRNLEYGEALEVVRGLKRISRRKTHPITVIFIADGVNEDMLRLVDNISIFTSMRMSFNISLFEYNKNSYMDVASVAPALNNLYVLIAEASAELLRRPKHLQTTVVEDNLLKVCTDLNVLKEAVESELLAEHHSRMHSPQHSRDSGGSGGGMPPSLPSINAAGDSRGPSDSFDANYISMSPLQSGLSRSASHALPSRPSVNPNEVHPDLDRFYRTDSFTATTLRSRQTRGRNEDSIESQKRTFKPVLQELEVLVSREFMFTLSNMLHVCMSLGRFFLIGFVLGAYSFLDYQKIDGDDDDIITSEYGVINTYAYNITAVLYSMVFTILLSIAPSVGHLHTYCRILKQEVIAGYVRESSCWISTLLFNWPVYIASVSLMGMTIWFFVGLHGGSDNFFGLLILGVLASYSLASCCAAWCSSGYIATRVYILVCAVFMGVCGFLRYVNHMPVGYGVLTSTAFSRFLYEGLMIAVFHGLGPSGQEYLESMNFDNNGVSNCVNSLAFWVGMLQLLFLAGLTPPSYKLVKVRNLIEKIDHRIKQTNKGSPAGAVAATNTESLLAGDHMAQSLSNHSEATMGPVDHYIPPMAITQDLQAKNYAQSSGINTGKRLAVKPLQVEDNPFRKVDVKPSLRTVMTFSRIKYTNNDEDMPDTVVQGVSGMVAPGETCCILDGNKEGAGSILLRVISGRASASGVIHGVVKANGTQLVAGYALVYSAFVGRGDSAHMTNLTVRQTLHYAALLRRTDTRSCPSMRHFFSDKVKANSANIMSSSEIEELGSSSDLDQRVEEVLLMMGLETVGNTVIGREGRRNLSPSQLRCLTIAVEIVNRPSVIFMDDPTYLLDWHHATVVSNAIKTLAAGGRTVICSMSKPPVGVFKSFNKCILLANSHMIYFGPAEQASAHFENIGFDNRSRDGSNAVRNPAEFILEIAADQGIMKQGNAEGAEGAGGTKKKRYPGSSAMSALSALDLADLCRSMTAANANSAEKDTSGSVIAAHLNANMRSKRGTMLSKEPASAASSSNPILQASFIGMRGADQVNDAAGAKAPGLIRLSTNKTSAVIGRQQPLPPIGPTSRVMIARTVTSLMAAPSLITLYLARYLVTGLILGTIFWHLNSGSYLERMALFASTFIIVSVIMVDQMDGIHSRKSSFLRERASRASTGLSYWVADSMPVAWLNFLGVLLFCLPVYTIPVLNPSMLNFTIFSGYVLAAVWCNLGLMYLVCMLTPDSVRSRLTYSGVLIPVQLFLSGYLILSSTMPVWTSYFAFVAPMGYFMSGCFRNEFEFNDSALGSSGVTYGDLEDLYGYHATTLQAFGGMVVIGIAYRLCWLVVLKLWEAMKRRENLRKYDIARKRLRVLLTAGVDWRDYKFRSTSSNKKTMEEDVLAEIDGNNYQPFN